MGETEFVKGVEDIREMITRISETPMEQVLRRKDTQRSGELLIMENDRINEKQQEGRH